MKHLPIYSHEFERIDAVHRLFAHLEKSRSSRVILEGLRDRLEKARQKDGGRISD